MKPASWFAFVCALFGAGAALAGTTAPDHGIAAFNKAFASATRAMDDRAALALWENDGFSLLPDTPALSGKAAIAKFLQGVTASLPQARMRSFELACHDIQAAGDWASEWCDEHQVVDLGNGKPPFDGRGRMLLVLHRDEGGHWRLQREMWQSMQTAKQ